MKDRAQQALHLLALDPVVESTADKNSYGFRPQRSCADAIEQCFLALKSAKTAWILEGDIKSWPSGAANRILFRAYTHRQFFVDVLALRA
jgi:retron-type reverse transcriptase